MSPSGTLRTLQLHPDTAETVRFNNHKEKAASAPKGRVSERTRLAWSIAHITTTSEFARLPWKGKCGEPHSPFMEVPTKRSNSDSDRVPVVKEIDSESIWVIILFLLNSRTEMACFTAKDSRNISNSLSLRRDPKVTLFQKESKQKDEAAPLCSHLFEVDLSSSSLPWKGKWGCPLIKGWDMSGWNWEE